MDGVLTHIPTGEDGTVMVLVGLIPVPLYQQLPLKLKPILEHPELLPPQEASYHMVD